jgi:hypothetical protein
MAAYVYPSKSAGNGPAKSMDHASRGPWGLSVLSGTRGYGSLSLQG